INDLNSATSAGFVANGAGNTIGGGLSVTASGTATIKSAAAAFGGGGSVGGAGSVTVNLLDGSAAAGIGGTGLLTVENGAVLVSASQDSTIQSLAGAVAGGGSV